MSVGLLYRYFPSKQAVVIALYDELSSEYARRTRRIAARPVARPFCRCAEAEPRRAPAASHRLACPDTGAGGRSGRKHLLFAHRVLSPPRAARVRAGRRRIERRAEGAPGGGARTAPVSRAPGGSTVVAAGQERPAARDGRTRLADPTTPALGGDGAPRAAGPQIRPLRRRAGSRRPFSASRFPPGGCMFLARRPSRQTIDRFLLDSPGPPPGSASPTGTLTNHAEAGEELFEVFIDPQTDDVMYRIRAISWPQATLARVGQPIVRVLQARFRRDSAAAMERATRSNGVRIKAVDTSAARH